MPTLENDAINLLDGYPSRVQRNRQNHRDICRPTERYLTMIC